MLIMLDFCFHCFFGYHALLLQKTQLYAAHRGAGAEAGAGPDQAKPSCGLLDWKKHVLIVREFVRDSE